MRITALNRGGLAVFGGFYDPHKDEAVVLVRDSETIGVVIEYPSAPSAMSVSAHNVTATTPAISNLTATFTLSDMDDCGYADVLATVGGAVRTVRIRSKIQTRPVDDYGCGGELI